MQCTRLLCTCPFNILFFKSDGIQYDNKYDIHVGCNNAVSKVFIHKYKLHNRVGQLVSFLLND